MSLFWASVALFVLGVGAWAGGYLKWTRHLPKWDKLRGLPCVPGFLMVIVSVVLFGFFWHWVVGTLVIASMGYGGYRLMFGRG